MAYQFHGLFNDKIILEKEQLDYLLVSPTFSHTMS